MSDYLQAASFIHAGKDWGFEPSNILEHVSIKPGDHTDATGFTHLVFSIPRDKMSSNASIFADWQTTEAGSQESQRYRVAFCWFLEYMHRLNKSEAQSGKQTPRYDKVKSKSHGDHVLVFFEWVTSDDGTIVGERIHLFNNRPLTHKNDIITDMLKRANQPRKKTQLFDPWDYHLKYVRTKEQIFINVYNAYTGNTESMAHIYKSDRLLDNFNVCDSARDKDFPCFPEDIFSLNNFKIEGARVLQNDRSRYHYEDDGVFKFPDEKSIVKRFWMDVEPSYLWCKYLPSHQYKWVDLPEIRVKVAEGCLDERDVYVKPCPAKCLIDDLLGEKYKVVSNTYKFVTIDDYRQIERLAKGRFIVHEVRENPGKFNPYPWITGNIIFGAKAYDSYGSESMEYTERLKSRFQNQHSISAFDIVEMETTYRMEVSKNRRKVQEQMVDKFVEQCVSGDSDISAAGKAIARWVHHIRPELYEKHGSFEFEIKDPSLSPFANMQFWVLQGFDMYLCVASAHPELLKLHYAAYDAYRQHGENELHWNMIYTGEGATSKSFVFETKKKMSIDGTITEITYQTTRADAVDGDQNDHITIFNESPPGLFAAGKNNQNEEALAMMKDKLTRNVVSTKTFERDEETGERKNRIAISSQIGVYMGATNDNPAEAEEAVKTRFHWGEFEKIFRKDKNISDYQKKSFDMESKPELLKCREEFLFYTRDQQMKVFYVWKFIFCKIIKDVSLDASATVLSQISGYLKREHQIRIPPRTVERYRILCRILTITNALDIVFNFKGGKHNGKTFEFVQLLDIEPLLYCTEELAVCAMNMVAVEIPQLTISRDKTIKALWKIFKFAPQYKKDRAEAGHDIMDYSYARFTGGLKPLCVKIQHLIPFSEGKPSLHNIFSVLKMLGDEPFRGRTYSKDVGALNIPVTPDIQYTPKDKRIKRSYKPRINDRVEVNYEDRWYAGKVSDNNIEEGYHVVEFDDGAINYNIHVEIMRPENHAFSNPISNVRENQLAFVSGQNFHDIHMDVFENVRYGDQPPILRTCIEEMHHSKTRTRKIVTGVPKRENGCVNHPQWLDIVEMTTGTREPPKIKNSNQETSGIQEMMGVNSTILGKHTHVEMDVDTDTYSWQRRCIGTLQLKPDDAINYHPEAIEQDLVKSIIAMTYPDDLQRKTGESFRSNNRCITASHDMGFDYKEHLKKRKRISSINTHT